MTQSVIPPKKPFLSFYGRNLPKNISSLKPLGIWGVTLTCAVWWIFDYKPFVMKIPYYRSKFDHEIPTGPLH
ncbi:hypothetical protein ACHWQZ_G010151 [Mnemiopsis leidyi]